jgi:hypothetical protein
MRRTTLSVTAALLITACSDSSPIAPEEELSEPRVEETVLLSTSRLEIAGAVEDALARIVPAIGDVAASSDLQRTLGDLLAALQGGEDARIPAALERISAVLERSGKSDSIDAVDAGAIQLVIERVHFLISGGDAGGEN